MSSETLCLELSVLPDMLAICRLSPSVPVPLWVLGTQFFSVTRTADELSIVCPTDVIPLDVIAERGWRAFQIAGPLDFSLVGVLSSVAEPLARAGISIFAISTYDTDYVLVREREYENALTTLADSGHRIDKGRTQSVS